MNKEKENNEMENIEQTGKEIQAEKQENKKTCVYCGPSVRGVARQYTVYTGGIPKELNEFFTEHPIARGLLVPVESFAQTRKKLELTGTAESIIFEKLKRELSK